MSYLDFPRMVFSGRFQADVSTVNNDVRHYDNGTWEDRFQEMKSGQTQNGWWNPEGTGNFRLLQTSVSGAVTPEGAAAGDPLLAARVEDNIDLPPAKLVDLDPQFQMASMIWGLQLAIRDDQGEFLRADYEPAPFRDLIFGRVAGVGGSGGASAKFTSRLRNLQWGERASSSPFLTRLRKAAEESGFLSANLMTYGYDTQAANATYTLGRILGVIGPWHSAEPKFFSAGRRFAPAPNNSPFATAEDNIGFFDARIAGGHIHLDLANALPLQSTAGAVRNIGTLRLVVLNAMDEDRETGGLRSLAPRIAEGAAVDARDFVEVGEVDYLAADWLTKSGGIVSFPLAGEAARLAADHPLALVNASTGQQRVSIRETIGGYFVRADGFERRVDAKAGASVPTTVELYCLRFGKPFPGANAQMALAPPNATQGGGPRNATNPPAAALPTINFPPTALAFSPQATAGSDGVATVTVHAFDPANVRGYLDGQIFILPYAFGFDGESPMPLYEQIILHVRDAYTPPGSPDWERDVEPVLRQFGNLYPIMSRGLFSFTDPEVLARHAHLLTFALSRPIEDPNHMPATRDLSVGKRNLLLAWLADMTGESVSAAAFSAERPSVERDEAHTAAAVSGPLPRGYSYYHRLKGLSSDDAEALGPPEQPASLSN